MTTSSIIATVINVLCAVFNTCWGIYWIKRLEKSRRRYNEIMKELEEEKGNADR